MAAKPRAVIIVAIVAVTIAVVASVSLYNYLKGQEEKVREAMEVATATEKVVVADEEIPIGTPVEVRQVKLVDWPKANVPLGAFSSAEEVADRVPLQTILPGDIITEPKLRPTEGPPGIMTYKIPKGHRAMTVAVDQVSGVAGFITPGSMVDVVMTTTPPGKKLPMSKIIFQNIPVLATGQIIETREGDPVLVPTVTLDVSPDDAEKLATASSEGRLRLLLRRAGDADVLLTEGATVTRVLREAGKPALPVKKIAKRPRARKPVKVAKRRPRIVSHSVEVWRDATKTVETFKVTVETSKVKKEAK